MKTLKITLLISLISTMLFSQNRSADSVFMYSTASGNELSELNNKTNLYFEVRGSYIRPATKQKLNAASRLEDIFEGYPTNWLNEYVSTEIISVSNGKKMNASGLNSVLTSDQKKNISAVDLGAEVLVNIKYKTKNSATNKTEIRAMSFSITVVPESEANFKGGKVEAKKYFRETFINKISANLSTTFKQAMIKFTINEEGDIINARITESTGNQDIDRLMLEGVNKMPKWNPAKNSSGTKVKQDFEFVIGNEGC